MEESAEAPVCRSQRALFDKGKTGLRTIILMMCAALTVKTIGADPQRLELRETSLKLGDISLQDHVCGPAIDLSESDGKLTVLYFWGMRCAPCLQTLPKLGELQKKLRNEGLIMIGIHAATGDADQIREFCRKQGVEFAIYRSFKAPKTFRIGTLPHARIFDASGKQIFDGHVSQLTDAIEGHF